MGQWRRRRPPVPRSAPSSSASLASLPPELLMHIAALLPTLADVVALACVTSNALLRRPLREHLPYLLAEWLRRHSPCKALTTAFRWARHRLCAVDAAAVLQALLRPQGLQAFDIADAEEALALATSYGRVQEVEVLLLAGVPGDIGNSRPLFGAAGAGHAGIVLLLLEHGARASDVAGRLALFAAAKARNVPVMRLLLRHGAGLDGLDGYAYWIGDQLVELAERGCFQELQLLLQHGVKTDAAVAGRVLAASCAAGHEDVAVLLLSNGARADAADSCALAAAAKHGHVGTMRLLLTAGASASGQGSIALEHCSGRGDEDMVRLLLALGARACDRDSAALVVACRRGHAGVVRLLLEGGAVAGAADGEPLVAAATRGDTATMALVLGAGTCTNARDGAALMAAVQEECVDAVELLLRHGANAAVLASEALVDSVLRWKDRPQLLQVLLEAWASAAAQDSIVLRCGPWLDEHVDALELLLAAGADPTVGESDALVWACQWGHMEIAGALLDFGASACAQDSAALVACSRHGNVSMVERLLEEGADADGGGGEALVEACRGGYLDVVEALLAAGAAAGGASCVGDALVEACRWGHAAVVGALLEAGVDAEALIPEVEGDDEVDGIDNPGLRLRDHGLPLRDRVALLMEYLG